LCYLFDFGGNLVHFNKINAFFKLIIFLFWNTPSETTTDHHHQSSPSPQILYKGDVGILKIMGVQEQREVQEEAVSKGW